MPRLDLAFGPPARRGVTTLMSVGADDPVTPVPTLDDLARRGAFLSGGVCLLGFLAGSQTLASVGFGGIAALVGVRWLAKQGA